MQTLFTYVIVWWTLLFVVLPLGVQRDPHSPVGHDKGAPKHPDLKRKLIWNTLLSAGMTVLIQWIIQKNIF